jgi:outer membrane protein
MKKALFFFSFLLLLTSNSISSEIAIVDINFLLKNSNKGKSILKELDNLNSQNSKKFKKKKNLLETEEKKIASKKNILSKEDFNKEVISFRQKVEKYEIERRKSTQEINNIKLKKVAKLLDQINKILLEYSTKNSISTVIDKKNIIITKEGNDITKKILKILDS